MESALAVELISEIDKQESAVLNTIVMDDDTATLARIRNVTGREINKISDVNHVKKNLGNALYNVRSEFKELTAKVIKYVQRCFGKALAQNKNDAEGVQKCLKNIPEHMFGNHKDCGKWCTYHEDPEKFKHTVLPFGRSLTNTKLKLFLDDLFKSYADNAEKLAPYGSTQSNIANVHSQTDVTSIPDNISPPLLQHLPPDDTSSSLPVAMQKFIEWLEKQQQEQSKCVVIGHNIKSFDCRYLLRDLEEHFLIERFTKVVCGFVDTLPLFLMIYPERASYSEESLVGDLLNIQYNAHNALDDVKVLKSLVIQSSPNKEQISMHSFSTQLALERHHYNNLKHANTQTLQHLVSAKVLSKGMASKIAGSGLEFCHLKKWYFAIIIMAFFDAIALKYLIFLFASKIAEIAVGIE